jgi:hypothetical protein
MKYCILSFCFLIQILTAANIQANIAHLKIQDGYVDMPYGYPNGYMWNGTG